MANELFPVGSGQPAQAYKLLVDQSDGSWAERVDVVGTVTANTEMTAAAAAADGVANPTAGIAQAFSSAFNGTTWDRVRTILTNTVAYVHTGIAMVGPVLYNGAADWRTLISMGAHGDGSTGANTPSVGLVGYNASTFDRIRTWLHGQNTTGTGVLATAMLAEYDEAATTTPTENQIITLLVDALRNLKVTLGTLISGEDQTLNRLWGGWKGAYFAEFSADQLVKSGAGALHTVTFSSDAAATAGTIIIYDNTAESGTIIKTITLIAAFEDAHTLVFDCAFSTGLYFGFTTTADVTVSCTYL